jgi:hypothetical protein
VFGHKSQVSWVSWLPADEIDFSALLISAGLFILHFGVDKCLRICYSITTLSPLIVIYRQVMPNHRKIGAFGGRKVKNRAITGNRKNR